MTTATSLTTASVSSASGIVSTGNTPFTSFQIPKNEVGVLELQRKYPTADGRNIRIAILDTGCDLAARGMQVTTTGLPKYLDFIDCTGDGDIDMSTTKRVGVNSTFGKEVTVTGVSGKTLKLPPSIIEDCAAGPDEEKNDNLPEVRLGAIPLYHILPKTALKRVREERKTKFLQVHQERIAQAQKVLDQLQRLKLTEQQSKNQDAAQNQSDKDNKTTDGCATTTSTSTTDTTANGKSSIKKDIQEAQLLIEQLQEMTKDYSDAGPIMDVVLYQKRAPTPSTGTTSNGDVATNDAPIWQALIDLNADGNLTDFAPMAPYAVHREFETLGFGSQVTFCIQVYEDGDILSIVCDAGSHGTHVAGIAAAYFGTHPTNVVNESSQTESQPSKDGVAPGAQVLACKIGDVRLGSTETGTGLIRALVAAKRYKCHLVNLSYGEPSWQPDSGRVSQVFHDAVHKWGMTVFTSAGNDGPALSTLGSPGTLSSLITVGAYVSPQMLTDQYCTLVESTSDVDEDTNGGVPGASYSFSSRGPTPDGLLPDICAPGGAIAPVPRHTLQGKSQKHGTSMASPNACGVAAVLLSALKENGINVDRHFNPHELRRALVNGANKMPDSEFILDPFAQGAGLISATRSLDYAIAHHGKVGQNLSFDVKIPSDNNARGIFIRDVMQLAGSMTRTVSVEPLFEHSLDKTDDEMNEMLSFELELNLVPTREWVQCPQRMTLLSCKERPAGQSFAVRIDPTSLSPGAHFATVDAIDSKDPSRGTLFQVPITVIVPHSILSTPPFEYAAKYGTDDDDDETMQVTTKNYMDVSLKYELKPGIPERRFLSVPAAAEWATIKLSSTSPSADRSAPHSIILHAVPFARGDLHNKMIQIKHFLMQHEGAERVYHLQVKGGSTLEVCLQLSWLAKASPASVAANIEFHSLDVRPPQLISSQPVRISASSEFARLGVGAPFRSERINPKATFSLVRRTVVPKEYKILAASKDGRDILPYGDAQIRAAGAGDKESPPGTIVYKSLLEYAFKLADSKDDVSISVTPRIPSLFHQIYDSPIDSQLWLLQDKHDKVLGYGGSMHDAAAISLNCKPGGEYKLTLRISHPNRGVLEQLKDLPLLLSMKLTKELECPVYSKIDKASTPGVTDDGREQVKEVRLRRGAYHDLYVTRPTAKLPDWIQSGDILFGSVKMDKNNPGATSLDLFYEVPPKSVVVDSTKKDDKQKDSQDKSDEKGEAEELAECIFKAKVDHLSKLRSRKKWEAYESLANELTAEKSGHLVLLEELLNFAKERKTPDGPAEQEKTRRASQVTKAVDAMKISNGGPIDEDRIAQYFGYNPPLDDDDDDDSKNAADKTKKEMDDRRKAWRSALLAKAGAWSDAADPDDHNSTNFFDASVKEMKKWVSLAGDLSSDKEKARHAVVLARHSRICHRKSASAMASLRKARKDLPPECYKELTEEIITVLQGINGMEYWLQQVEEDLGGQYPKAKLTL